MQLRCQDGLQRNTMKAGGCTHVRLQKVQESVERPREISRFLYPYCSAGILPNVPYFTISAPVALSFRGPTPFVGPRNLLVQQGLAAVTAKQIPRSARNDTRAWASCLGAGGGSALPSGMLESKGIAAHEPSL